MKLKSKRIKDEYVKIPLTPIQILHFKLLYNIVYFKKIYPDKISKLNLSEDLSELLDNEKEILSLSNDYSELINSLKKDKNQSKDYLNISFLEEQYEEAVVRLFLHFANLKIENLINRFEKEEKKDFTLLQKVEDLKKKKEIYQNTI